MLRLVPAALVPAALALASLVLVAGCYHAGAPSRTAETLPAGHLGGRETLNAISAGQGTVTFSDGQTLSGDVNGEEAAVGVLGLPVGIVASLELGGRVGVTDHLELGAEVGLGSDGLELRYGLLDERRGAPLSLAISGAGFYRPLREGFGGRAGIDVSKRLGRFAPFVGAYATYGAERYVIAVPESIDAGPPEWIGPYVRYTRNEARVVVPIGVEWSAPKLVALSLSVVPYVTLAHGRTLDSKCVNCEAQHPIESFDNGVGATLVWTVQLR